MNVKLSTSPRLGWRGWSAIVLVAWAGALQVAMWDVQAKHKDALEEAKETMGCSNKRDTSKE